MSGRYGKSAYIVSGNKAAAVKVALTVGGVTAGLLGLALLGPWAGSPLLCDALLVEELLDCGGTGGTGQSADDVGSQDQVAVSDGLAVDTGRWAVDDGLWVWNQC